MKTLPYLLPPDGLTADQAAALALDDSPPPALANALAAILIRLSQEKTRLALDTRDTLSTDHLLFALPPLTNQ